MAFSSTSGLDALLRRPEQESLWSRLRRSPLKTTAQHFYNYCASRANLLPGHSQTQVRVVCISDTHTTRPHLPDGDILIHAGDLTQSGSRKELTEQIDWLGRQPHRHKVVIAGNHELCLDPAFRSAAGKWKANDGSDGAATVDWKSLIYLENSSTVLHLGDNTRHGRHLKVFGSPCTPKHGNWAFQYPRHEAGVWEEIGVPGDADILVTHGPPKAHLDLGYLGCRALLSRLWSLERKPVLHVFGHIHGGYGKEVVLWDSFQRAYESIMDGKSGFLDLVKLAYYGLGRLLRVTGGYCPAQTTVMVNAAAVGGVRDEKRREAICVDI